MFGQGEQDVFPNEPTLELISNNNNKTANAVFGVEDSVVIRGFRVVRDVSLFLLPNCQTGRMPCVLA